MTRLAMDECGGRNVAAFLDMIAYAEGTPRYSQNDGYDVLAGGKLFHSYADHPRIKVKLRADDLTTPRDESLSSTAAGRYQFLVRTWDGLVAKLGRRVLPDFSPESQDRAAIELLKQRGAYSLIREGRVYEAINACRKEWASLPGAGYGQRELRAEALREVYVQAGGIVRGVA